MRRVVWSEDARADLVEIRSYIEQFNPAAARRLATRLVATADSLMEFADRGCPIGGGRRELASVAPYVIRYRVTGDRVEIIRVRHGARRPD